MTNNVKVVSKVIAIDGPSGSGKSTIAQRVAKKLNLIYLDTGAMFRALGYVLQELPIDFKKAELTAEESVMLTQELAGLNFEYGLDSDILIRINGQNLTDTIRLHEVSALASVVSKFSEIRSYLKVKQREIAEQKPSVLEGRDIGTVIFPNAAVKIFLTASSHVRAQRRYDQLVEKDIKNQGIYSMEQIQKDIEDRDESDKSRAIAPLKQADDATVIDTSEMNIDDVMAKIISSYEENKTLFN